MDSNPIDEALKSGRIEATEDVEAHGKFTKFGLPQEPNDEDVEGHASRFGLVEDDVEGHGFRGHVEAHEDDDTEGHMSRGKG